MSVEMREKWSQMMSKLPYEHLDAVTKEPSANTTLASTMLIAPLPNFLVKGPVQMER